MLLAEDEPSLRRPYEREIQKERYVVLLAQDGMTALRMVRVRHPDLVVLDIRMPGLDGMQALARILEEDNRLPVIILTAYPCYKDSFLSWSADAYLVKSADLTGLKEVLRSLVRGRWVVGD